MKALLEKQRSAFVAEEQGWLNLQRLSGMVPPYGARSDKVLEHMTRK
jgi:hypothetical protein